MDWKKVVGQVAPTLATALGGPLAGTAIGFLSKEFLGTENAPQEDIEKAILSASPESLAKLKEIDAKFKRDMKALDVDLERIAVDDRKSARELAKDNMWPQITLSVIYTLGYFGILVFMMANAMGEGVTLDPASSAILNVLFGVLSAGLPMILRFWFGGSPQDKENMERVYNSVPKFN